MAEIMNEMEENVGLLNKNDVWRSKHFDNMINK